MKAKTLSIAGFDGSGGAGMQADLKVFSALGSYGMSVLTALPVQNTQGVKYYHEIPTEAISQQLEVTFEDIVPDTIKIGMLFNAQIIEVVANFLKKYASHIPIVLDPVMVSKSGHILLLPEAVETLKNQLVPLATIITPNLPEASVLTGITAQKPEEMYRVSKQLLQLGPQAVLLKGGHLPGQHASDLYHHCDGTQTWLHAPKIETNNTHGTGCTLSAAIAACLSLGLDLLESCRLSKRYLHQAIIASQNEKVGHGAGPVHHFYHLWPTLEKLAD